MYEYGTAPSVVKRVTAFYRIRRPCNSYLAAGCSKIAYGDNSYEGGGSMKRQEPKRNRADTGNRESYRVRLPGFIIEEEVGLGDVIKRATSSAGISPCDGCARRAAMLNRWLVFSRRRPK